MSIFESGWQEVEEMTPSHGFNVCTFDDYAPLGEKLTGVAHVETREEAEAIKADLEAQGAKVYIYGKESPQNLAIEEIIQSPEKLVTNTDYLEDAEYNYPDTATASKKNSEPSMHNEEGWTGSKSTPEWKRDQVEQHRPKISERNVSEITQVNVPPYSRYSKYIYQSHDDDDICSKFANKVYDLQDYVHRPVPPSEGLAYTNTHPNCKCYWEPQLDFEGRPDKLEVDEQAHVTDVHRKIGQRARRGTLHKIKQDGKLSQRTTHKNPRHEIKLIRETVTGLAQQFNWITPDYIAKVKELSSHVGGAFLLVRASAETVTDHRSEGEPYRRLLKGDELAQLTRTGIGKATDINHLGEDYKTDGLVLDAQYDPMRKESQMLVYEKDPEILQAIIRGDVNEVSINAGMPRRMDVECDPAECYVVPTGLVLGELDGIAFTWVVSNPSGIRWRGRHIPKATAGVKTTAIEIL